MPISASGKRGEVFSSRSGGRWAGWGLAGLLCLASSWSATAQDAPEPSPTPGTPGVELLLESMLTDDRVLSETLSGAAWDVQASPGRRLMQLPLRVTPGTQEGLMEEPRIGFGGSRFIGWWLPVGPEVASPRGRSRRGPANNAPSDQDLLDLAGLLEKLEAAGPDDRRNSRPADPPQAPATGEALPEDAPRLARKILVKPNGQVSWEVARLIPGAVVKSGETPYLLYLDGQRLRDLKPEKQIVTREGSETSRDFSLRRREIDAAYRETLTAYRELQNVARNVPKQLEADLPDAVWAVFEVNAILPEWSLRGGPEGTWSMSFDEFEAMRSLAGGQGISSWPSQDGGTFSTEDRRLITRLDDLSKSRHVWTQRLLARALADSGYARNLGEGDTVSAVFKRLLESPDLIARNRTVYALATTSPATPATAKLLEDAAAQTGDPAIQLAALRTQLALQVATASDRERGTPMDLAGVIATVNANLANPAGADAGMVIKQLLVTVPIETPEAVEAVVAGIIFDGLPSQRFDAAVAAVLSSAASQPAVVGGWVDRQLLGSSNRDVVRRTLELMGAADTSAPMVSTFADALRGAVFGRTTQAPAEEKQGLPRVTMETGLPLGSATHSLFKLLNAGDPAVRKAGWSVLRHFELTDGDARRRRSRRSADAAEGEADPLTMIVDAGLSQPVTPSSLVPFLLRQPDQARANGPLLRVILTGDTPSSRRAARALLGSQRELGSAIAELEPAPRAELGNLVYDRLGDGPEPVTGLLRQNRGRRGGTANWFGEAWARGELPAAADWAERAGNESALLRLVGGEDEGLAHGAIAALAASAGADRAQQQSMIDRFKDEAQNLSSQDLAEGWADAKRDIYTARLASAAGEYRLSMFVIGETAGEGGAGRTRDEVLGFDAEAAGAQAEQGDNARVQRTVLGGITLVADGRSVSFSGGIPTLSVSDERLALRIADPGQLLAYAQKIEALQGLPLDGIEGPLDLLPEDGGVWRGQVPLPDGRGFGLEIEPRTSYAHKAGAEDEESKDSEDGGTDKANDADEGQKESAQEKTEE